VKNIYVNLNAVHPVDKMDMHKKTREIGITKLQAQNEKLITQLKNEKLGNRTKKIRVEELEQWVMDMGANPQDVAFVHSLVKTKDIDIQELKKRLNIHGIEHVETP
jgi:hypothetical protein